MHHVHICAGVLASYMIGFEKITILDIASIAYRQRPILDRISQGFPYSALAQRGDILDDQGITYVMTLTLPFSSNSASSGNCNQVRLNTAPGV